MSKNPAAVALGRIKSPKKTAANPKFAAGLEEVHAGNRKELEDITCCGRDPHLKSCLRYRAMQRRQRLQS